ncbi:MAG: glycosyltransferase family 2 protein [Pseudomonadota bacterium]
MTKLIVQIPCFNEAETLPETVRDIPRAVDGVDVVEVLVIDDGSSDDTIAAARVAGVDHIVSNKVNLGLARTFQVGLDEALRLGADIVVNTDGDNQYQGADIPLLVAPIVQGSADIVVGDRQTATIAHFSPLKKMLQRWGSRFVRGLSGVDAADAVSGFRAFSRNAAMAINVRSSFSYTIETLIQAGKKRLTVLSVPVRTNSVTRPSRLFRSIPQFLFQSAKTMARVYAMYEPLKVFLFAGVVFMVLGAAPIVRFVLHYLAGDGQGMVQSLILGGVLFLLGAMAIMFALIADLVAYNRQLIEQTLERVRRMEFDAAAQRDFPEKRVRDELAALQSSNEKSAHG